MHIRSVILAGIAAMTVGAGPALAGDAFYVGAGLGIASPSNSEWRVPALSQFGQYSLKDSNTVLLEGGFKFWGGLRLGLQGQYGQFDGGHITLSGSGLSSPLDGHVTKATVYVTANYDFPIFQELGGTIGAGVGSAWDSAHGSAFSGLSVVHGDDRSFAWQLDAGITHHILANLDLQLDYRYQGNGSATLTESGVGDFHLGNITSQTVALTARLYLLP